MSIHFAPVPQLPEGIRCNASAGYADVLSVLLSIAAANCAKTIALCIEELSPLAVAFRNGAVPGYVFRETKNSQLISDQHSTVFLFPCKEMKFTEPQLASSEKVDICVIDTDITHSGVFAFLSMFPFLSQNAVTILFNSKMLDISQELLINGNLIKSIHSEQLFAIVASNMKTIYKNENFVYAFIIDESTNKHIIDIFISLYSRMTKYNFMNNMKFIKKYYSQDCVSIFEMYVHNRKLYLTRYLSSLHTMYCKIKNILNNALHTINVFWSILSTTDFVIIAPNPRYANEKDGYIQRIRQIDLLLHEYKITYIEGQKYHTDHYKFIENHSHSNTIRLPSNSKAYFMYYLLCVMCILTCRKVYFHSILQLPCFLYAFYIPFVKCFVDLHGVVSEEFRMKNDYFNAVKFDKIERIAAKDSFACLVVSQSMRHHIESKYRRSINTLIINLPNIQQMASESAIRENSAMNPVIVYAGGMANWQQLPKMAVVIKNTALMYQYKIYCPDPKGFRAMLPLSIATHVTIDSKTHAELMELYPTCHYGFILRSDSIVNRVACPTKLVEYLAFGIVPIVDSPDIGDFRALGMRYVTLEQLASSALPDEAARLEMARHNRGVYEKLQAQYEAGAEALLRRIFGR